LWCLPGDSKGCWSSRPSMPMRRATRLCVRSVSASDDGAVGELHGSTHGKFGTLFLPEPALLFEMEPALLQLSPECCSSLFFSPRRRHPLRPGPAVGARLPRDPQEATRRGGGYSLWAATRRAATRRRLARRALPR
jgi:hypothetical protein